MHPNALLDLSTELLRQVLKLTRRDTVVSNFFKRYRNLSPRTPHAG